MMPMTLINEDVTGRGRMVAGRQWRGQELNRQSGDAQTI